MLPILRATVFLGSFLKCVTAFAQNPGATSFEHHDAATNSSSPSLIKWFVVFPIMMLLIKKFQKWDSRNDTKVRDGSTAGEWKATRPAFIRATLIIGALLAILIVWLVYANGLAE